MQALCLSVNTRSTEGMPAVSGNKRHTADRGRDEKNALLAGSNAGKDTLPFREKGAFICTHARMTRDVQGTFSDRPDSATVLRGLFCLPCSFPAHDRARNTITAGPVRRHLPVHTAAGPASGCKIGLRAEKGQAVPAQKGRTVDKRTLPDYKEDGGCGAVWRHLSAQWRAPCTQDNFALIAGIRRSNGWRRTARGPHPTARHCARTGTIRNADRGCDARRCSSQPAESRPPSPGYPGCIPVHRKNNVARDRPGS